MKGLQILTLIYTAIRLVAIFSGFVVLGGLMRSRGRQLWTFGFLVTAGLAIITGFMVPFQGATPAFILGLISLVPLALAPWARYKKKLIGAWRGTYVISAVLVLYFNVFVLIVQAFQKIPVLHALAPTQTEQPFKIAQLAALCAFLVMGVRAHKKFGKLP